jgi:hypothetical protein
MQPHKTPPKVNVTTATGDVIQVWQLEDGSNHINIYSEARTELGRKLTNFAKTPFDHPTYGHFESMEGFWHWCSTGKKSDSYRDKYGLAAKMAKRRGQGVVIYDYFESDILSGLHCKLQQHPNIHQMLLDSTLPLTHYYAFSRTLVDGAKGNMFWLKELEAIRKGKPLSL